MNKKFEVFTTAVAQALVGLKKLKSYDYIQLKKDLEKSKKNYIRLENGLYIQKAPTENDIEIVTSVSADLNLNKKCNYKYSAGLIHYSIGNY